MARLEERSAYRQIKSLRRTLDEMLQEYNGKLPDTKQKLKSFCEVLVSEVDGAARQCGFEPYPLLVKDGKGNTTTLDKILKKGNVKKRE